MPPERCGIGRNSSFRKIAKTFRPSKPMVIVGCNAPKLIFNCYRRLSCRIGCPNLHDLPHSSKYSTTARRPAFVTTALDGRFFPLRDRHDIITCVRKTVANQHPGSSEQTLIAFVRENRYIGFFASAAILHL